tara:strand:+ start:8522 stop:8764 length:243 start_codon:yes stop_codon:yes gene_type:complete
METVFVVYKTDAHHSYASRDIIGIATDKNEAINICQLQAKKEGEVITTDEMFNLENITQTQGYNGEGEFQFEELELNKLY